MTYSKRHGGPYDRGSADRYYGRCFSPHYYTEGAYQSEKVPEEEMTKLEIEAYTAGWDEEDGCKMFY